MVKWKYNPRKWFSPKAEKSSVCSKDQRPVDKEREVWEASKIRLSRALWVRLKCFSFYFKYDGEPLEDFRISIIGELEDASIGGRTEGVRWVEEGETVGKCTNLLGCWNKYYSLDGLHDLLSHRWKCWRGWFPLGPLSLASGRLPSPCVLTCLSVTRVCLHFLFL